MQRHVGWTLGQTPEREKERTPTHVCDMTAREAKKEGRKGTDVRCSKAHSLPLITCVHQRLRSYSERGKRVLPRDLSREAVR